MLASSRERRRALNAEAQNACSRRSKAAGSIDVCSRDLAADIRAADGAPPMPAAALRAGCRRAIAASLIRDHEYADGDAHAAASLSDGSIGRALQGATDEFVDAREAAVNLLDAVASSKDPWQRLGGAKALAGSARGGSSDREELARRLYALSSIVRDLGATPRGRTLSRERRSWARSSACRGRSMESGAARFRRLIARWRRRSERKPEDRCGLAGVSDQGASLVASE